MADAIESRAFLGLSDAFYEEIREYFEWKNSHSNETTTNFARVRQNLHGDTPLPWTAVQIYLSLLIKRVSRDRHDTQRMMALMVFPPNTNLRKKFEWYLNTRMRLLCSTIAIVIFCFCGTVTP